MGYLERLFIGSGPSDLVHDSIMFIRAWLTETRIDASEAEFLADMTLKVDWEDQTEKNGFIRLMEYLSLRGSISEDDMSWPEVVRLDWTWPHPSYWLSFCIQLMLLLQC